MRARRSGFVGAIRPVELGYAVVAMGGGRTRLGQEIDPRVGFVVSVEPGDAVDDGELLGRVHAATEADAERGGEALSAAVELVDEPPRDLLPLVGDRITAP